MFWLKSESRKELCALIVKINIIKVSIFITLIYGFNANTDLKFGKLTLKLIENIKELEQLNLFWREGQKERVYGYYKSIIILRLWSCLLKKKKFSGELGPQIDTQEKQRHYFANKGSSSQGYGFSCGHVSMWELDCEEGWAPKNWCFWSVVLEKTPESPLDCKEIQPVHSEGDQPWDFFGRNDAKAETPVLWPPHAKSWLTGKDSDAGRDWGQEEKGTIEDEISGWPHWLDGRESEWVQGVGDGQGGLAYCDSWGRKESDTTERLNWTEHKKCKGNLVQKLYSFQQLVIQMKNNAFKSCNIYKNIISKSNI